LSGMVKSRTSFFQRQSQFLKPESIVSVSIQTSYQASALVPRSWTGTFCAQRLSAPDMGKPLAEPAPRTRANLAGFGEAEGGELEPAGG
jgi:hypothetical protein